MKKRLWIIAAAALLTVLALCCAAAAEERTVTLTVNGSAEASQTAVCNANTRLVVQAPGATAVRLRDGNRTDEDHWNIYEYWNWNTAYIEETWNYSGGTKVVYAEARYDDIEGVDLWSEEEEANWRAGSRSNTITLTVPEGGEFTGLQVSWITPTSGKVTRGKWIQLRASSQETGARYWADIAAGEDSEDWFRHFDFDSGDILSIPTVDLEPGKYTLRISASAPGKNIAELRLEGGSFPTFQVTKPTKTPGPGLYMDKETVGAGEPFNIAGYLPEGGRMGFLIRNDDDPTWRDWQERDGGLGLLERWTMNDPGAYTVVLYELKGEDTEEIETKNLTVTAPANGTLDAPDLTGLPKTLGADEDLSGVIVFDTRADELHLNVQYSPDGRDWSDVARINRSGLTGAGRTEISLPASLFTEEGFYSVWTSVSAYGFRECGTQSRILRTNGEPAGAITLTVNGGTEDISDWPSSTELNIQVNAPGATAVRLLCNGEWWDCRGVPEEGLRWMQSYGDGEYLVMAQMTTEEPYWRAEDFDWGSFDWEDLDWSATSNVVRVRIVSPNGSLEEPEAVLSSYGVRRGEELTVTVTPQVEGEWYWAKVQTLVTEENGNLRWEGDRNWNADGGNTIRVQTLGLEPGDYWLEVGVDAQGWRGCSRMIHFTVLEPDENMPEAVISFSRDSMRANENMTVYAMAPGCEYMRLDIYWDRDQNWYDWRGTGRDDEEWGWGCGCGGEYSFVLVYKLPGREENSVCKTFFVESDGALEHPEFSGIPFLLNTGDGISGSFSAVEGAEWYHVGLQYSENGWDWEELVNEDREADGEDVLGLVFDGSLFMREGTYRVWVNANAVGLDNGYAETRIQAVNPENFSEDLVLKIAGQTDGDNLTVYLHQGFDVTVDAPENVTAVRVRNSYEDWDYRYVGDEPYHNYWSFHRGGEEIMIAQATTDRSVVEWLEDEEHDGLRDFDWNSVSWTMISNVVTVDVIYYGDLDAPTVTFPNGSTVERGAGLAVQISPVRDAYGYGIRIHKVREDGTLERDPAADFEYVIDEETVVEIPTYTLEKGTYRLFAESRRYGYQGLTNEYSVTVTEENWEDHIVFEADRNETETNEIVLVSLYVPGAEEVWICQDEMRNDWWRGEDRIMANIGFSWAQPVTLFAMARYPGEEERVRVGEPIRIKVTAANGPLSVGIDSPDVVEAGTAFSFRAVSDFRGSFGNPYCELRTEEWEEIEVRKDHQIGENYIETITCYVDEDALAPGTYIIQAGADAGSPGFSSVNTQKRILVTEPGVVSGGLELRVEGETDGSRVEAKLHQNVRVTVSVPEGVTAIRVRNLDGDGWDCRYCDSEFGGYDEYIGVHNGGNERFVAQASTDSSVARWADSHGNLDEFDWDSLEWSMISNIVTVNVIKYGDLDAPAVEFPNGRTVERGEMLEFTVEPVKNAYCFGVQMWRAGAEDWERRPVDMEYNFTGATQVRIPTGMLEPGEYVLSIDPRNHGWHGNQSWYTVTVIQTGTWADEPFFTASARACLTREAVTFSIYAPGAREVILCNGTMDNVWWHEDGESLLDRVVLSQKRVYHTMAFANYPGEEEGEGEWRQIGETIEIDVDAPNGSVGLDVTVTPENPKPNEDLTFTMTSRFGEGGGYTEFWAMGADGTGYLVKRESEESVEDGVLRSVYSISGDQLEPGVLFVEAYAIPYGTGYELAGFSRGFAVSGNSEIEGRLTVDRNTVKIFEDVHMTVSAPGATALALFYQGECEYAAGDYMESDMTMWWDTEEPGELVYAKFTTDEIVPGPDGIDWQGLNWNGVTNFEFVLVEPPEYELEPLRFELSATTVKRGEDIVITLLNENEGLEHVSYGATLIPLDDENSFFRWFGPEEGSRTFAVNTAEAVPGEYDLMITVNALSCHGQNETVRVTVAEPDGGIVWNMPGENVITCTEIPISIVAAGAEHLRLDAAFAGGREDEVFEADGDGLFEYLFTGEEEDTAVLTLTAFYPGGRRETAEKRVAITAPNGVIHPAVTLYGVWRAGEDLKFRVDTGAGTAAQYTVSVRDAEAAEDDEALFFEFVKGIQTAGFETGAGAFEPGKLYVIEVNAAGRGYSFGSAVLHVSPAAKAAETVLTLPGSMKSIQDEAFAGIAAEKIVVPEGVRKISARAFADCPNLIELELPEGIDEIAPDALAGSGPVMVYGPEGSWLEDYAAMCDDLYFVPVRPDSSGIAVN